MLYLLDVPSAYTSNCIMWMLWHLSVFIVNVEIPDLHFPQYGHFQGGSQMSELNMLVQMHDMMTEAQKVHWIPSIHQSMLSHIIVA